MSGQIADIIIWVSPVLAASFLWFVSNHISDVKDNITQVKGQIGGVKDELIGIGKDIVKIQVSIEYLKDRDIIERDKADKFENHVVTILKDAKTKFK